jgi:hypothetical protein
MIPMTYLATLRRVLASAKENINIAASLFFHNETLHHAALQQATFDPAGDFGTHFPSVQSLAH